MKKILIISIILHASLFTLHSLAQPAVVKNATKSVFSLTTFRADGSLLASSHGVFVGNEGEGLRQLTRKACDELAALPMAGKVESLNAATAGSVMIYLAYMKRLEML